jgi:phenylacetate-CoA ligase
MNLERVIFGKLLLPAAYSVIGDTRISQLPRFLASERWSPEVLERDQIDRLRKLLVHAEKRVPYYRDLFHALRFDPSCFDSLEQLKALPPMTRELVKGQLDRFLADGMPSDSYRRDATGGSTGTPMEFFHEERYRSLATASALRTRTWAGWQPGCRTVWIWGAPQETQAWRTIRGRAIGWISRNLYVDAFRAGPSEMQDWLRRITRFKPAFVYGYASSIAHFAAFLDSRSLTIDGVQGVFSTAEKLHPWQREVIERVFQCKVYDHYGSREIKAIAAQCEAGSMHILSDLNLVEMEDPSAETSPLLITSLENFAMPFIRYRIGDIGALQPGACECGRVLPRLRLAIGRQADMFVTPEGRHVHGEYFTHLMYGMPGIASFQFYQPSSERIILRAVPDTSFDEDVRRRLIALDAKIRREVSPAIGLEIALVDDIPPSPTGKFRFTWSDVSAPVAPSATSAS